MIQDNHVTFSHRDSQPDTGSQWTTGGSRYNPKPAAAGKRALPVLSVSGFFNANRRLIIFSFLLFFGVGLGTAAYALSGSAIRHELSIMLKVHSIPAGFPQVVSAFFSSCFSNILLLSVLFVSGMSACGVPVAVGVPFFFGLGVGMTQAYYYTLGTGGILMSALLVTPHSMLAGAALILGGMEASRMSLLLSRQLLPSGTMGGLWMDFKLYIVRFLILTGISLGAAAIDVCLRLIILPLL